MFNQLLKVILFVILSFYSFLGAENKALCLTMIVKNESKIIERCLESVKDIVDCISICDTGSTDNTVEVIENFMKANAIPGKVHRHVWENFGHNRTLSFQAAQEVIQELKFSASGTYCLLVDADMILNVAPSFNKNALTADAYKILQKSEIHSYYNVRLIRANFPWKSIGVTHEYWAAKGAYQILTLNSLWIDDQGDGGCKTDKFERDLKLLKKGLEENPDNVRYQFYLAQTYKCLGQYEPAITWYKSRIAKEGWKEEVWYSKWMIGECYQKMGYWSKALRWYLDAYQYHPSRSEPLYHISTYYRKKGDHDLAYLFAKQGARIPYPKNDILFVSHPVYDYQFDEEISITAYYTPFKDEGFAAADRLILNKNVPEEIKNQTYRNILFYTKNLTHTQLQPIQCELPLIREGFAEKYFPMNPSIQKTGEGYDVICRTVNFNQKGASYYQSRDPLSKIIQTRNYLLQYDKNLKLLSQREILEESSKNDPLVQGLEDCRLFSLNHSLWFSCTTRHMHPAIVGQSLCKLDNLPNSSSTLSVEKIVALQGPDPKRNEKNWLPFVKDQKLHFIYAYDPLTIYQFDPKTGEGQVVFQYDPINDFSNFRGSAGPIPFDDGYLVVVHEVVFKKEGRVYLHRFLYLDQNFMIKKVSHPFTFLHQGIEFCSGMTVDHTGEKCILTIGYEDQKAYFVFVNFNHIRSLLNLETAVEDGKLMQSFDL